MSRKHARVAALFLSATLPCISSVSECQVDEGPNLTGTWELNLSKSKFEGRRKPLKVTLVIKQIGAQFELQQKMKYREGETTASHITATIDAKAPVVENEREFTKRILVFWYGPSIVVAQKLITHEGKVKRIDLVNYTLKANGTTLLAEEKDDTPGEPWGTTK